MDYANLTIGIVSAIAAITAACYAYKAYLSSKTPKLVMETPDNAGLFLRNVGTDSAKNIKETTEMFRDVPTEIWNFNGPIDYIRVKSPGTARMINFHDQKRIQPSTSTVVRFEYENSDGERFYSEIKVERGSPIQQVYFLTPALVNSGKI